LSLDVIDGAVPFVIGVLGLLSGNIPVAIICAALIFADLIGGNSILMDEDQSIWFWNSYAMEWKLIYIPPTEIGISYVPSYLRTGSYTFWDDIGISNP